MMIDNLPKNNLLNDKWQNEKIMNDILPTKRHLA